MPRARSLVEGRRPAKPEVPGSNPGGRSDDKERLPIYIGIPNAREVKSLALEVKKDYLLIALIWSELKEIREKKTLVLTNAKSLIKESKSLINEIKKILPKIDKKTLEKLGLLKKEEYTGEAHATKDIEGEKEETVEEQNKQRVQTNKRSRKRKQKETKKEEKTKAGEDTEAGVERAKQSRKENTLDIDEIEKELDELEKLLESLRS